MIEWYCAYDAADGEIIANFICDEANAHLNAPPNTTLVKGAHDPTQGRFVADVFTPYSAAEAALKQVAPPYAARWSNLTMQWVDLRSDAVALEDLRRERNSRLSACDWTQVPDAPVNQAAWAAYRQALRDLPGNTVDPRQPVWPEPPQ